MFKKKMLYLKSRLFVSNISLSIIKSVHWISDKLCLFLDKIFQLTMDSV
jgi:hypothetical protein